MSEKITIEISVDAPVKKVWEDYTSPEAIVKWNAASEDWHSPKAENDLRVGGRFLSRMEAKDGSAGFDFTGTYTDVRPHERIAYTMDDGREVEIRFTEKEGQTMVAVAFDPEEENSREVQRDGWLAILENFKRYASRAT